MMTNMQKPPIPMPLPVPSTLRLAAVLLLLCMAAACGNKGDLYLEDRGQSRVSPDAVINPDAEGRDPDENEQDEPDATISASGG